jgi:hypothetical protein
MRKEIAREIHDIKPLQLYTIDRLQEYRAKTNESKRRITLVGEHNLLRFSLFTIICMA